MVRKILMIFGCLLAFVVFGAAEGDCGTTSEDSGPPKGWNSVHLGDTENQVLSEMGEPRDKQRLESGSEFGESRTECWYYGDVNSYQICFNDAGEVDAKNDY